MKNKIKNIYPANSLQQGFVFQALHKGDDAYIEQFILEINDTLDIDLFIKAWEYVIKQYPSLRTAFNWEEEIIQVIYEEGKLDYKLYDISFYDEESQRNFIENLKKEDRNQLFSLNQLPLFRIGIIKIDDHKYIIIKSSHHIILDGWSTQVMFRQLIRFYEQLVYNQVVQIEEDLTYLESQEYIFTNLEKAEAFWKTYLNKNIPNDINNVLDAKINIHNYYQVEKPHKISLEINKECYGKIKTFSKKHGININTLLQFSWHKILQTFGKHNTSVVGTVFSGRNIPVTNIENSVGLFANTLPVIVDWDDELSIQEKLLQLQNTIIDIDEHSFSLLADLHTNGEKLFNNLFSFQNYPGIEADMRYRISDIIEKFDYPLCIQIFEYSEDILSISLSFDEMLLKPSTGYRKLHMFETILDQIVENPDMKHQFIKLISQEEEQKYIKIQEDSAPESENKESKIIIETFEKHSVSKPDNIAVAFGGTDITYQELNELANQLGDYLRKKHHIKANYFVGVRLLRSEQLIVALLGVLKSGAAYVPISPEWPEERQAFVIGDTNIKVIIDENFLDNFFKEKENYSKTNLSHINTSDDFLYVIYTSGTTGNPKGVPVSNHNLARLFDVASEYFDFHEKDVWTLFHSYAFDFSVWEIFGALLYGGKLIVVEPHLTKDLQGFIELCAKSQVTILNLTPSFFYLFTNQMDAISDKLNLRYVILGGEAFHSNKISEWWKYTEHHDHPIKLINMYGITEGTVHVTYKEVFRSENGISNIGKALKDFRIYILDDHHCLVPDGVIGELYISGPGVVQGYLNREDLTQARFVDNPFVEDKNSAYSTMYKTGDMVKRLETGDLEYIGRNDKQVKIRGHRIELGEIESKISEIPFIKGCCVIADNNGSNEAKELLCYYLLNDGALMDSRSDLVKSWQQVFDYNYNDQGVDVEADFTGWNSFITDEKIPEMEMEKWRSVILNTIGSVQNKNILEIGVGTGLLMFNMIKKNIVKYIGIDLSAVVIDRLNGIVGDNVNVELFNLDAHQIDQLPVSVPFDTIIISSVCQYFPNISYFENVVSKALEKLELGGKMIIADIRDYSLHRDLIEEKMLYQNKNFTEFDIDQLASDENELLISQKYFELLNSNNPNIEVTVSLRQHHFVEELSKYRYDIVILKKEPVAELSFPDKHCKGLFNIPNINLHVREAVKEKLSTILPSYMIPNIYMGLNSFPLNTNGKLEFKLLPRQHISSNSIYLAPRNENEIILSRLWSEILGGTRYGIADNFFKSGGNSISAILLVNKLKDSFNMNFNVGDIFTYSTIEKMGNYISENNQQSVIIEEWEI
ncbi:non-ribosomal peptide synthetase [Chryseobacterium gallinarum]|uniref:Amino acid adenylation domain-containing protein n=1 Tax=Chryseobacterium gallinarum TaxID=1324352 RepID=A0ABX6KQ98_CHRGL|nr:non-ribosomal peptide synthetase [Chryseobacterium gallinarum]QIY90740.1 amino acid adenylation domain-containing protein [Chryseobacterium gallinarum]